MLQLLVHFRSASELAERLSSTSEDGKRARSLVSMPFEHISKGIGYYLDNGAFAVQNRRRLFVGTVENMATDLQRLARWLLLPAVEPAAAPAFRSRAASQNATRTTRLSALARRNLCRLYNGTDYAALRRLVQLGLLDASRYNAKGVSLPRNRVGVGD